ncbi:MAG: Site-specific recombinase [Candidatus Saccharibacteria bacterium GW2011_GWC2_48_9]|nr:MAG: Site-specific recombinase [Candidatus Saccharibacteria bacterium GW2011_GWC2_48_9]
MRKNTTPIVKTGAVIYTRVSSERQVENMSLGEQEKACMDYCSNPARNYDVKEMFVEKGESAKSADRTKLKEMLAYCSRNRKDIGYVIIYKVDRLSRNVEDFLKIKTFLKALGIEILSASEPIGGGSNTDRLMENILASFAQFDNEVRGERSKVGIHATAAEGGWVSPAPSGYRNARTESKQPTLAIVESQYKPITKFFNEFSSGKYTQEEAVALSRRCGVETNKGEKLARNSVIKMLRSITYAGYVQNKATDYRPVKGLHEGFITLETFNRIQAILDGKSRPIDVSRKSKGLYPLKRFLLCGICSKALTASSPKGKTKSYESYHCHRCTIKKNGARVSVSREQAHEQFRAQLERAEPAPWVPDLFRVIVLRRWSTEFQDVQKRRHEIDDKIRDIEKKKNTFLDLLADKSISVEAYQLKESQLSAEKSSLTLERDELKDVESDKERVVDNAVEFLRGLQQTWSDLPFEHKQKFQSALFLEPITVFTNGSFGTPHFSPIIQQTTDIENHVTKNKIDPSAEKSIMAGVEGFEPPNAGTKIRCLTTWRHPNGA